MRQGRRVGHDQIDPVADRPVAATRVRESLSFFVFGAIAAIIVWALFQPSIDGPPAHRSTAPLPRTGARPTNGDLRTLFSTDDYPAAAIRKQQQGSVQAQLDVSRTGRVTKCTIRESSGSVVLDKATCSILRRRAQFTPARDVDGKRVPDQVMVPKVVWRLQD